MLTVQIDDKPSDCPVEKSKRLSDVVSDIVAFLPPNRIVTEICVDGKQVFNRTKHLLDFRLEGVHELKIRTTEKAVWETNGLEMAQTSLERIQRSLVRVAELFREPEMGYANRFFARCVDGLERFVESITITRFALKLDFEKICVDGITLTQIETQFSEIFRAIVSHQREDNPEAVAEKIEYELLPNLGFWLKAIRQLRISQSSNA